MILPLFSLNSTEFPTFARADTAMSGRSMSANWIGSQLDTPQSSRTERRVLPHSESEHHWLCGSKLLCGSWHLCVRVLETLHDGPQSLRHRPWFLLRASAGKVRSPGLASTAAAAHQKSSSPASRHHPRSHLCRRTLSDASCVAWVAGVAQIPATAFLPRAVGNQQAPESLHYSATHGNRLHLPPFPVLQNGS